MVGGPPRGPISDYIVAGFSLTARRFHLVILDMAVKLTWIIGTTALFALTGVWFASRIFQSEEQLAGRGSNVSGVALLETLRLLAEHSNALAWVLLLAASVSLLGWMIVEAFVRGGILPLTRDGFLARACSHFGTFLLSGLLSRLIFLSAALLLVMVTMGPLLAAPIGQWGQLWQDVRWPGAMGLVLLSVIAFFLMTLETLLRSGTLDFLRSDFNSVVGIVGYVTLLETVLLLVTALTGAVVIGIVSSPGLGFLLAGLAMIGLSGIHSCLLLARYFSLGIMRREKREKGPIDDDTTD